MPNWTISLGKEGPTDSTLILTHPEGHNREAFIESEAWFCLSAIAGMEYPYKIPTNRFDSHICNLIWAHANF